MAVVFDSDDWRPHDSRRRHEGYFWPSRSDRADMALLAKVCLRHNAQKSVLDLFLLLSINGAGIATQHEKVMDAISSTVELSKIQPLGIFHETAPVMAKRWYS